MGRASNLKKLINHYLMNWVICQSWLLGCETSQHLTSQARIVFPCYFCSRHVQYDISGNWDCGRHTNMCWLCTRAHVNFLLLDKVISPVLFGALSQRVWEAVLFHSVAALIFVLICILWLVDLESLFPCVLGRSWGLRKRWIFGM
jgi:hypothetical protein